MVETGEEEATQSSTVRRQSGQQLLFLLADAPDDMCPLQSLDTYRAAELSRASGNP